MRKKRLKRMAALALVFVLMAGAVIPAAAYANAAGMDMDALENDAAGSRTGAADGSGNGSVGEEQEPVLYRETDRPGLEPAEVLEAEKRQPETEEDADSSGEDKPVPREDEPVPGGEVEDVALSEGEIETFGAGDTMTVQMASAPVLMASGPADSMNVSCSGYAKYCGHSMGIKYVSESGAYNNHLVYCLELSKNTTAGAVGASGPGSSIKPEITYCLVNGARMLNGTCYNSKYSEGSAPADYFITGAAIHVLNGEVGLGYYDNGSSVYYKIAALVSDAENYDMV